MQVDDDVPQRLLGDSQRIRQVLLNLLTNATKFTERGSVSLRVSCATRMRSNEDASSTAKNGPRAALCFAIEDTGIGVPEQDAERIFEAFTQAEERSDRRFGGTGLGLALCRQLLALMHGTVHYMPRPGGGSVFTVQLALDPVQGSARISADERRFLHAESQPPAEHYVGRVLLAEDNPVNREVMVATLESLGISVQCVDNGFEAIAQARAGAFDLVLMDCQMPLLDGYAATAAIRARETQERSTAPLPIVALTANAFAEDRARALAAGMNDFMAKPVLAHELHRVLGSWLSAGSSPPQLH